MVVYVCLADPMGQAAMIIPADKPLEWQRLPLVRQIPDTGLAASVFKLLSLRAGDAAASKFVKTTLRFFTALSK